MEGGGPLRSPLGQHHQPNQMDYSLSSMSRFPGFHPMPNQTSLQPTSQEVRDPLRVGSGETEVGQQMGAGHMLSPGQEHPSQEHMRSHHSQEELRGQQDNRGPVDAVQGESRTGSGGVDHRLGSNSPSQQQQQQQQQQAQQQQQQQAQQQQQQANMDPNNAAYLALRNHPETTIRPISSEMRSPGAENEQQSPRAMEENLFKQQPQAMAGFGQETKYSAQQGFHQAQQQAGPQTPPTSASAAYTASGGGFNDVLNSLHRYRMGWRLQ